MCTCLSLFVVRENLCGSVLERLIDMDKVGYSRSGQEQSRINSIHSSKCGCGFSPG